MKAEAKAAPVIVDATKVQACVEDVKRSMELHARVMEDSIRKIALGIKKAHKYEFKIERDTDGLIKSVIAVPVEHVSHLLDAEVKS
jgi:hypothetical protein